MNKIAKEIEKLIKKQIKKEGLIDSGKLYDSIKVKAKLINDKLEFEIIAEDYYEYLDDRYKLTENALKDKSLERIIEIEIAKEIENKISSL